MVVDGSNLAYRAFHKFQNIRTISEGNLGLVYGFIKILQSYLVRFNPDKVVVVFDTHQSKKSNFRNSIYPEYKASRRTLNLEFDYDSFNKQLRITKKLLGFMGISVIWDKTGLGHETDDYIADICIKDKKHKIIIISSDKDFCQLLREDVKIFNSGKDLIIRDYTCIEIMEYTPSQHKDMLILTGDNSDNIKGYKGVGPVKAKAFFNKFESIQDYLDSEEEFPWVTKEGVQDLYERNRPLIDLEYGLSLYPIKDYPLVIKDYNYKKLFKMLDKYAMASFLKPEFIKPIKNLKPWIKK